MRFRTAVLVSVLLLSCGAGWSQTKSLGDVAGSIKLNPEAIVEKKGIVEDPRAAKKADGELLVGILTDCSAVADQLGALVDQVQMTNLTRGDQLLTRLGETSNALGRQIQEIYTLRLGGDFAETSSAAWDAADSCDGAVAGVNEELSSGGSTFIAAKAGIDDCRRNLGQAQELLAAVMSTPVSTAAVSLRAPPAARGEAETSLSDDEIVNAKCEPERSRGAEFFEACREEQYLSQAAMASRSAANEMLGDEVFADIRDICGQLNPDDFVGRNICEQDRMTAARLEIEE